MRKLFIVAMFIGCTIATKAQVPFTFDFGVKGSINSSKITTDNPSISGYTFSDFKSDAKSGYNLGVFARLGGKKVYLQPELLFSKKQSTTNFMVGTVSNSQTVNLRTVQIPVLLGVKLIDLKLASVRAFTGPAMSFVLNSSDIQSSYANFYPNNLKNNVWDWQLGGGVDVGMLTFDVRYEWGLTNISDQISNATKIGFVNKGNYLTFSLGFKFI